MISAESQVGRVLYASRRWVEILSTRGEVLKGKTSSKAINIVPGDLVVYSPKSDLAVVVESIQDRRNCLSRTYLKETKDLVSNLDHLFVVAAAKPLFNTTFIDRVLVACTYQAIPVTIVLNKSDLPLEETKHLVAVYSSIGIPVLLTSAKCNEGLDAIREILNRPSLLIAAFCGISGVGKSSLLNLIIPGTAQRTAEVSRKTGQGVQTTSQSYAHPFARAGLPDALVVDLPGIQKFGISDLSRTEVAAGYPEFLAVARQCPFSNCSHTVEPNCAVRQEIDAGKIASSRYESYLAMLEEIEQAKEY